MATYTLNYSKSKKTAELRADGVTVRFFFSHSVVKMPATVNEAIDMHAAFLNSLDEKSYIKYFYFSHDTLRRSGCGTYDSAQAFCDECNREIFEQGLFNESGQDYVKNEIENHLDFCKTYGIYAAEFEKTEGMDDDKKTGVTISSNDFE